MWRRAASGWLGGLAAMTMTLFAGDDIGLVRVADSWRWLLAGSGLATPPAGWREAVFDDSNWAEGPAGFTFAGSTYEATTFDRSGERAGPVLLRRRFVVEQPEEITWLILRVDWSGGFVAYLNGQEIVRRNLPGQPGLPVPLDTTVPLRDRVGREEIDLTTAIPLLQPGENVLAIQWHEHSSGGYGSGLVPELLADCTRGPALGGGGPGWQMISWRAPFVSDGWVEYGRTPELGETSVVSVATTNHVVKLEGLDPGGEYFYQVVSRTTEATARSPVSRFRTLRAEGPIEFMVTADVGSGRSPQYGVAGVLQAHQPDLVLMAGDLVYPSFEEAAADFRWYSVYAEQLRTTPVFVVAGNHDVAYVGDHSFASQFAMPTNGVMVAEQLATGTGPKGHYFYSFDHGDVHFVGLYVPIQLVAYSLEPDTEQVAWLAQDLAASDKPWKILFLHHPLMSSGPHGWDDYNRNGRQDTLEVAEILMPLVVEHGVQLVFSGHDHIYERLVPVEGVQAVVTGAGGGSRYPISNPEAASVHRWSRYHCVHVRVDGPELTLKAVDWLGEQFDEFYLRREPPPPETVLEAAFGTPDDGADLPADGDGNRTGQRFEFAGTPLGGVMGAFSNPGRLWVNVDETFLYLGMEAMVLPEGDDLILFLEVPGQAGVTSLAGVGNGQPPPDDEGANALDLLENLAFAPGFEPSVACVLGDELADDTDRQFVRTEAIELHLPEAENARVSRPLALGQGVFRLDTGLPAVPGCRIQQFNLSPQVETASHEHAANYAVVSLPLAELGLSGGERLRIGAVVARNDPPPDLVEQRRWLDRSYVGLGLSGGGFEPSVLAGVPVQLPGPPASPRLEARLRPDGQLELSWDAGPGLRYRLEVAADLRSPFVAADVPGQPRLATLPRETWLVPGPAPGRSTRFYRLVQLP